MRTVAPIATTALEARAYYARAWAGGWVVASPGTEVTLLDASLSLIGRHDLGTEPKDVTLDANGRVLTLAGGGALSAFDTSSARPMWTLSGQFLACLNAWGSLWAAEGRQREVEISVRDPATGRAQRAATAVDPFGGSAVMFFPCAAAGRMVVWVAAGQDGQTAYLADDDGKMITTTEITPRDRLPPVFSPTGNAYLSAGDGRLEYLAWPSGDRIMHLSWPGAENEDDNDPSGSTIQWLPGGFATWSSENGRIYLVDLTTMAIVDEIIVAGHPVRTVEELYPTLVGDTTPCSDFEYAEPGPEGLILSVHARTQLAATRIADWSPDPSRQQ